MINLEDDIFQAHCQIDYLRDHIENGVRLYIVAHGTKGNLRPTPDDPPRAIEGTAE